MARPFQLRPFQLIASLGACLLASSRPAAADEASANRLPFLGAKYCTACHLPPPPDAITREHWPQLFELMSGWIRERQMPFDAKEYAELLALYEAGSPAVFAPTPDDLGMGPLGFQRGEVGLECSEERPKITNVNVTDLDRDGKDDVLVCDDVTGRVTWLKIDDGSWEEIFVANIVTPVKTTVLDYNGDGHNDIVVASLGFISPTDDLIGSVWLLVNRGDLTFEPLRLIDGLPRVADAKPLDYNGDGKTDFVVACYGWRKTGGIVLLEQVTPALFLEHRVAELNGAMQVEVTDFDGDGSDDFLAMFAQEHESIELFLNDGNGMFERRILAKSAHPAFGSSGIQLVDLDRDGDLDILSTNGDMMDEVSLAKPYHGVRWLENVEGTFRAHELAAMPGCYRAVARDMNGDGHLDIVVSSLNFNWNVHDFPSLIWLENDGRETFQPHAILHAPTNLATMDVGDLNHDGRPDIIVGGMHLPGPLGRDARLTAVFATGLAPAAETIKPSSAVPPSPPTSDPDR